jgi:hypothetical protein
MNIDMKKVILIFSILLLPSLLFAYTVVLKNGKRIDGRLMSEEKGTVTIRDREGVLITIKPHQIDESATEAANVKKADEGTEIQPKEPAARYANQKKSTGKVFTKEDLKDLPEVSIIGSEQSEAYSEVPYETEEFAPGGRTEAEWIAETRQLGRAIRDAEENFAMLKRECESAGAQAAYNLIDPTAYVFINGVWVPVSGYGPDPEIQRRAQEVCFQKERAEKEMLRLYEDLDRYQEYARRMGALPGWVEPDRVE